jgi:hypothetical protein
MHWTFAPVTSTLQKRPGVVLVSDQRVFAAREVAKVDARLGGYVAVGGHGGILGSAGGEALRSCYTFRR